MAQSPQKGGYAFVKDTFGLPVAVMCSEDASLICKKNKLTFVELLRPFCRLTSDGALYRIIIICELYDCLNMLLYLLLLATLCYYYSENSRSIRALL